MKETTMKWPINFPPPNVKIWEKPIKNWIKFYQQYFLTPCAINWPQQNFLKLYVLATQLLYWPVWHETRKQKANSTTKTKNEVSIPNFMTTEKNAEKQEKHCLR